MRKLLEFLIAGAAVRRFHALEVQRPPTVAEHSWGAAMICSVLAAGKPSASLLLAALTHDLAESETGDVPSHTKRVGTIGAQLEALEQLTRKAHGVDYAAKLTVEEAIILNLADQLEGMLYCVRERRLGNRNVAQAYERWALWLSEQQVDSPALRALQSAIGEMWKEANK